MKIQLIHPGTQKHFRLESGYKQIGNQIIREWNCDGHFRKFIQNYGHYVNGLRDLKPKQDNLYFWGEWEGNSFFEPILNPKADYRILPNGLHKPFHSTAIRGSQNTDPYIYGDNFKYCVCKQTGQLMNLCLDDLILFGSVFPRLNKFYIDTVYVIKDHDTSKDVQATRGTNYSQVYKEETLEQLEEYLKPPKCTNNNRVYHSKTWWDDKDYFSFVPCKLSYDNIGFERLFIELSDRRFRRFNLSTNSTGKSFLKECELSSQDLWKEIVRMSLEQGFKLGVKFDEPTYDSILNNNNNEKRDAPNIRFASCGAQCFVGAWCPETQATMRSQNELRPYKFSIT